MKTMLRVSVGWSIICIAAFLTEASRHGLNSGEAALAAVFVVITGAVTTFCFHAWRNQVK